ncbi:MAG: Transcription activator effector binding protein [Desulfotomaculum sp. 46_296]|nr:MAG: Transcription activator effector binding protein [Desulfotomaculum sp. 46_296]HAU32181.1 AraC family transcriptional regulator [Desulfotomaculum sp.]
MSYKCEVSFRYIQLALTVRTTTRLQDLPKVMEKSLREIKEHLAKFEEEPTGPPFAAYYDMNMESFEVEIGFPVSRAFAETDNMKTSVIPGGKIASCTHTGPYLGIPKAYQFLSNWVKENGYETKEVVYEIYFNDPAVTPPQELTIQIFLLLK